MSINQIITIQLEDKDPFESPSAAGFNSPRRMDFSRGFFVFESLGEDLGTYSDMVTLPAYG